MRILARSVTPEVAAMPGAVRPIRLRAGGITYQLRADEAIDLANQLVDATEQLAQRRTSHE